MSLDFPICRTCNGYVIEGTLKRTGMTLSSRCRCQDDEHDQRVEAQMRKRAAEPLPPASYPDFPENTFGTVCTGDPLLAGREAA